MPGPITNPNGFTPLWYEPRSEKEKAAFDIAREDLKSVLLVNSKEGVNTGKIMRFLEEQGSPINFKQFGFTNFNEFLFHCQDIMDVRTYPNGYGYPSYSFVFIKPSAVAPEQMHLLNLVQGQSSEKKRKGPFPRPTHKATIYARPEVLLHRPFVPRANPGTSGFNPGRGGPGRGGPRGTYRGWNRGTSGGGIRGGITTGNRGAPRGGSGFISRGGPTRAGYSAPKPLLTNNPPPSRPGTMSGSTIRFYDKNSAPRQPDPNVERVDRSFSHPVDSPRAHHCPPPADLRFSEAVARKLDNYEDESEDWDDDSDEDGLMMSSGPVSRLPTANESVPVPAPVKAPAASGTTASTVAVAPRQVSTPATPALIQVATRQIPAALAHTPIQVATRQVPGAVAPSPIPVAARQIPAAVAPAPATVAPSRATSAMAPGPAATATPCQSPVASAHGPGPIVPCQVPAAVFLKPAPLSNAKLNVDPRGGGDGPAVKPKFFSSGGQENILPEAAAVMGIWNPKTPIPLPHGKPGELGTVMDLRIVGFETPAIFRVQLAGLGAEKSIAAMEHMMSSWVALQESDTMKSTPIPRLSMDEAIDGGYYAGWDAARKTWCRVQLKLQESMEDEIKGLLIDHGSETFFKLEDLTFLRPCHAMNTPRQAWLVSPTYSSNDSEATPMAQRLFMEKNLGKKFGLFIFAKQTLHSSGIPLTRGRFLAGSGHETLDVVFRNRS